MVGASGSLHSSSIPNTWKAACGIKAARHVRLANQRIPLSHKISAQSAQQSCCVGKRKFPSQLPSAVVAPAVQQEVTLACLDPLGSCLELRQRLVPRHLAALLGGPQGLPRRLGCLPQRQAALQDAGQVRGQRRRLPQAASYAVPCALARPLRLPRTCWRPWTSTPLYQITSPTSCTHCISIMSQGCVLLCFENLTVCNCREAIDRLIVAGSRLGRYDE